MPEPLPPALAHGSLLLHVGPAKTGTTSIQKALSAARPELAEHGTYYPGPFEPPPAHRPVEASLAVLQRPGQIGWREPRIELWEHLAADLRANPLPRACLSNEAFSGASEQTLPRLVGDLGQERLHVLYVARRFDRTLLSIWQQHVKGRVTWPLPEFLHRALAPEECRTESDPPWLARQRRQQLDHLLPLWTRQLDPGQLTVLIAEDGDHEQLPRTFEALLGLPDGFITMPPAANTSLAFEHAEAIRAVNEVFDAHDWSHAQYHRVVQRGVTRDLMERPGSDVRPGIPADLLELLHEAADAQVEALLASGVRVLGDPEALRTRGRVSAATGPGELEMIPVDLLAQVVESALDGAFALERRRVRQAGREAGR